MTSLHSHPRHATIDKQGIRALVPHAGLMCLLDRVLAWEEESITCVSETHLDLGNPLRRGGRLSSLSAFEYGAQAIAIHGGLRARAAGVVPPEGYLAAMRDARLYVERLDDITGALEVRAVRLFGDTGNAIYQTGVYASAGGTRLAEARITVMLRMGPAWRSGSRRR